MYYIAPSPLISQTWRIMIVSMVLCSYWSPIHGAELSCKSRVFMMSEMAKKNTDVVISRIDLMRSEQQTLMLKMEQIETRMTSSLAKVDDTIVKMSYVMNKVEAIMNQTDQLLKDSQHQAHKIQNMIEYSHNGNKAQVDQLTKLIKLIESNYSRPRSGQEEPSDLVVDLIRKTVKEELQVWRLQVENGVRSELNKTYMGIGENVNDLKRMLADTQERVSGGSGPASSDIESMQKDVNALRFRFERLNELLESRCTAPVTTTTNNNSNIMTIIPRNQNQESRILAKNVQPIIEHSALVAPCPNINPKVAAHRACNKELNAISPKDCAEVYQNNGTCSDSYIIRIEGNYRIYCDMSDGGGWTVILRRGHFAEKSKRTDFRHNWKMYRNGFGDSRDELWLGNEKIHRLTSQEPQILRIELFSFDGRCKTLYYSNFHVLGERENYRMIIGEPIKSDLQVAKLFLQYNHTDFVTSDRFNDFRLQRCELESIKTGWWMNAEHCTAIHLTGVYRDEDESVLHGMGGIRWTSFDAIKSLKQVQMSIRPISMPIQHNRNA
ncbi:angiopoietin-4-like isoform X2 [Brevipalpus obovatus]